MEFRERLKIAMEIRNKRAVDICENCGIKKGNLSRYINGKLPAPKIQTAQKIADYLNVNVLWLLGMTDNISNETIKINNVKKAVNIELDKNDLMKQTLMDDIKAIISRQDLETLKTMYSVIKTLAKK